MRIVLIGGIAVALAGCATAERSVAVNGQLNGQPAGGQATARGDGAGSWWIKVPGGAQCEGTYNSLDESPALVVPATCSDGRHGEAVLTRNVVQGGGTAIVTLNDGSKGQFVFGNLSYDQAFGQGGLAKTNLATRVR